MNFTDRYDNIHITVENTNTLTTACINIVQSHIGKSGYSILVRKHPFFIPDEIILVCQKYQDIICELDGTLDKEMTVHFWTVYVLSSRRPVIRLLC